MDFPCWKINGSVLIFGRVSTCSNDSIQLNAPVPTADKSTIKQTERILFVHEPSDSLQNDLMIFGRFHCLHWRRHKQIGELKKWEFSWIASVHWSSIEEWEPIERSQISRDHVIPSIAWVFDRNRQHIFECDAKYDDKFLRLTTATDSSCLRMIFFVRFNL